MDRIEIWSDGVRVIIGVRRADNVVEFRKKKQSVLFAIGEHQNIKQLMEKESEKLGGLNPSLSEEEWWALDLILCAVNASKRTRRRRL